MTADRIVEILSKKKNKRSEKEGLILYGMSMKFIILKQLSKIIQKGRYLSFINKFKVHRLKPGEIIYHVGDHSEYEGYFILQGKLKLYRFRNSDIDIRDE